MKVRARLGVNVRVKIGVRVMVKVQILHPGSNPTIGSNSSPSPSPDISLAPSNSDYSQVILPRLRPVVDPRLPLPRVLTPV